MGRGDCSRLLGTKVREWAHQWGQGRGVLEWILRESLEK